MPAADECKNTITERSPFFYVSKRKVALGKVLAGKGPRNGYEANLLFAFFVAFSSICYSICAAGLFRAIFK